MSKPIRVLIVEDSENDALLLVRELRRGGFEPQVERVDTTDSMAAALAKQTWDIVISDYTMPHFSGIAALELVKKSGIDIPFIVVSGSIGEDVAVATMKAGAHDYMMKGNLQRLIASVERELREVEVRRERKRAVEAVKENLNRIRALHEIDLAITSTLNLKTILDVLLEKIDLFVPYPSATTVRLLNKETGQLEAFACRNLDEDEWKSQFTVVPGGRAMRVLETKAPVTVKNVLTDPRTDSPSLYHHHGLISYIGIPFIVKDEALGVLSLYTRQEHEFSDQEIEFLTTLAGQAAIAIHNAQLFEETVRSKKTLETTNQYLDKSLKQLGGLYTAMTPVACTASSQEMMGGIIDRLMEATGADAALIRVCDKGADTLSIVGHRGFSDDYIRRVETVPAGGAVEWVIKHREPIVARDIASEPRFKGKMQLQLGLRSCAMLPLIVHQEVRGVIHIASQKLGYFDEEQKDHLAAIARQMSIALENRELFYELESSRDELERANAALTETNQMLSALHKVAAAASQSLDLDQVLRPAIEKITEIFGFEATQIHLYNQQTDEMVRRGAFEKYPDRFTSANSFRKGQGIVGTVAESGEPLVFEDVQADPRYRQLSRTKVSGQFGYHFFAVFPIKSKLRNLGTLACTNTAPRKLTSGEVQLLEALTDQISVAIENSELYESVRQKVQELEQKTAELEKANKVKDEFLSVMSHELRTPLNVIMGYTGLLHGTMLGEISPNQMDATSKIMAQCRDLLSMVNSILQATQIGSGQTRVLRRKCSLSDLLDELKSSYAIPQLKELTLTWDYPANLLGVRTDEEKLKHILQNLINNAIKFTAQGHIMISAR